MTKRHAVSALADATPILTLISPAKNYPILDSAVRDGSIILEPQKGRNQHQPKFTLKNENAG